MDGPASILVACNPLDGDEIVAALAAEPGAPAIVVCNGGDDTIARFAELRPEVVVVCATLDAGDARMLISALRGAAPAGTFQIVLVGDVRGPVRNALDAADFVADRFVARPLSAKALRYAFTAGVSAARRGRVAAVEMSAAPVSTMMPEAQAPAMRPRLSGTQRAVMITPPGGVPVVDASGSKLDAMLDAAVDDIGKEEVQRRTSGGFAIPVEAILAAGETPDVTAPMSVHDLPTRPVGELEARRHALAAVTASDSATFRRARTVPPPPPSREPILEIADDDIMLDEEPAPAPPPEAPMASGSWSGSHELPPGLEAPVLSETQGSFDDGAAQPWPAQTTANLPKEDEWDAPPIPTREPTMILTGPNSAIDVTERSPGGRWAQAPAAVEAMDEETDGGGGTPPPPGDELDGVVEDNLDGDLAELSVSRPVIAPEPPPSGGDFARELRKKMSLMAQRLFRGGEAPTVPPVDVRPPHDFRTEIDLAEIDVGAAHGSAEGYDGDATFAGDDHGLPTSPGLLTGDSMVGSGAPGETTARTAESGEITRGTSDAAVLIARMFVSEFTGQVVLRRPGAEKVIYFDGGRPVFASSDQATDRMGELLFREGKITDEQYRRCRDLVLESGRRMGEILVDKGFLKRRELLPAVRRHVEDIIYSLFAWDAGEYRIIPGDGASSERIRLSRHPAAMVLEGVRRKLDLGTLERLLGPASTVVEVADRDKAGTVISVADLSTDERGALAGMDGSTDLAHVARATGAQLVTVYQLAWAMTLLGIASIRRRGGDDDDAPALVGETDLAIDRDRVRARHRLVDEADYFALLGVRRDATAFEIRRAYEAARRDFDADGYPPELRSELTVELAEIGVVLEEAFAVLRDDRLRGEYLANLAD